MMHPNCSTKSQRLCPAGAFDMKLFTDLYVELDQTNKTNEKVEAIRFYFERAAPHDAAWALYFLSGRKPRQIVPSKFLREWSLELSDVPEWLYLESRDTVGDGAETMALLLPNNSAVDETPLHILVEDQLLPLRDSDEPTQKAAVTEAWSRMKWPGTWRGTTAPSTQSCCCGCRRR